jgi:hypothetical protein
MTKSLVVDGLSTIDLSTFNEDWLNWPDAPGGEQCLVHGDNCDPEFCPEWQKDHEPFGEDVDFAQAQMVAECAEASWYRFMVA